MPEKSLSVNFFVGENAFSRVLKSMNVNFPLIVVWQHCAEGEVGAMLSITVPYQRSSRLGNVARLEA
jgi:hypothetical protein